MTRSGLARRTTYVLPEFSVGSFSAITRGKFVGQVLHGSTRRPSFDTPTAGFDRGVEPDLWVNSRTAAKWREQAFVADTGESAGDDWDCHASRFSAQAGGTRIA